jgi:hypothetical protein
MDRVHGLWSTGLQHSETIPAIKLAIIGRDLISQRVIFWSNPSRQFWDGRRLEATGSGATPACDDAPWLLTGGRCLAAPKVGLQRGFIPWHYNDAGRLFRWPLNGDERWWQLATERRFGRDLTMSRVTCSASPMTWTAPKGVADLREAPGIVGLVRATTQARWWGRAAG